MHGINIIVSQFFFVLFLGCIDFVLQVGKKFVMQQ